MSKTIWKLDASHSEVMFKVKHMMITNVTGNFREFEGNAESDDDQFANPAITFSAKTASVDTNSEQRDGHLKSADFFDAVTFPTIDFKGTSFTKKSNGDYLLEGELSLHGITKPIQLDVEFGGINKDPWGQTKAGFTVSGKINRSDFGLTWNSALETGGVLVSEDVKIHAEIQMVKA